MPEWSVNLIIALIAAVTSVPVWNTVMKIVGRGGTEIDRLRREINEVRKVHNNCEREVAELKTRLAIVEHHHSSHFARWIRDAHKRLIWANSRALLSVFAPLGFSRLDEVEGKTLEGIFDPGANVEIELLDQAALANPGAAVSNLIRLHPDLPLMHIVNVAATGREGELIYEGIAFRTNDPMVSTGLGVVRQHAQIGNSIDNLTEPKPDQG